MTLQHLIKSNEIVPHQADAAVVQRLIEVIGRSLVDAGLRELSNESRFDLAYFAAVRCALVAMMAAGYRPASESLDDNQELLLQSLPFTLGAGDVWVVLDALDRQRGKHRDRSGAIPGELVAECQMQAESLYRMLLAHLRDNHPQLLV